MIRSAAEVKSQTYLEELSDSSCRRDISLAELVADGFKRFTSGVHIPEDEMDNCYKTYTLPTTAFFIGIASLSYFDTLLPYTSNMLAAECMLLVLTV